jgi:hypothetical protein
MEILLEDKKRSYLVLCEDGFARRIYKDTSSVGFSCQAYIDGSGRTKVKTRTLRLSKHPKPHVTKFADRVLQLGDEATMKRVSEACGVKECTAWSYACEALEFYDNNELLVSSLIMKVHPEVWDAISSLENRDGSLRDVLRRVHPSLTDSKGIDCLFGHIRLARLLLI